MIPFRPLERVLDVVVDPVAVDNAEAGGFGLVDRVSVDSEADRLAHALVVERVLRVLEPRKFEPEISGNHRRQHHPRIILDPGDQLSRDAENDVGLATLQHRHAGGGVRHADDREMLDVDRPVVTAERLEFELGPRLVGDELVGPGADRLLHKTFLPDFFVIPRWNDPSGTANIGGAHQPRKIKKRCLEVEADRALVDDRDPVGQLVQDLCPGASVMLVTPFDVRWRDRRAVVKFDVRTQSEGRASGVFGKVEAVGERKMIEFPVAEVLDQRVMHDIEKIVRCSAAVVLQRVEPARSDICVPREHHAVLQRGVSGRVGLPHKWDDQPAPNQSRRLKHGASRRRCCRHFRLHPLKWASFRRALRQL